jgi:predicted dehydrogenase
LGTLTSIWHDNLARPSLRRVEVFCERRHVIIEGDDWFGPVQWTDHDGAAGSLGGDEIVAAVSTLVDGSLNPDGEFVRAVVEGRPAFPDFATALDAHRIVDAMYRSAEHGGTAITIGHD